MTSPETHIIQTAKLQLHFANRDQAYDRQTEVLSIFKEKVLPELEQEFEKLSIPGQVIRLDQLRLDLGKISPVNLGKEFEEKVIQELRTQLRREISRATIAIEDKGMKPLAIHRVDQLIQFLRNGRLGWEQKASGFDPVSWLDFVLEHAPQEFRLRLKSALSFQGVRARMVRQFTLNQVDQVLDLLRPGLGKLMTKTLSQVSAQPLLINLLDLGSRKSQILVREYFLSLSVGADSLFRGFIQELGLGLDIDLHKAARLGIGSGQVQRSMVTGLIWSLLRTQGDGGFEKIPKSGEGLGSSLELVLPQLEGQIDLGALLTAIDKFSDFGSAFVNAVRTTINSSQSIDLGRIAKNALSLIDEDKGSKSELKELLAPLLKVTNEQEDNVEENPVLEKAEPNDNYIYLEQAGLVLLNPFLPTLFERLGWVKNEAFVGAAERELAVHMLGYLATGRVDLNEAELVLEKVMCGMEIDEPIDAGITFTQAQLVEAEELIQSAIDYWEKLGKVNAEEFRNTFLVREGKLSPAGDGWNLKVERRSFDILLQFIPWGYGIIRFPWMDKMLHVDW